MMLKVKPPNFKFCPFCGKKLSIKKDTDGAKRKYCAQDNWTYYPSVVQGAAAVVIKRKKLLLVKRARKPYKGTWMFPAGFVSYGEHPQETAIREANEETGLLVKNAKLIEILQSEDDPRWPGHLIFFFKVDAKGETKNLDRGENKDIAWFDIKNPPKIGWKTHKYIIKKLQSDL